eukprot:6157812-Pleurochrysis_carterae.AAC.2
MERVKCELQSVASGKPARQPKRGRSGKTGLRQQAIGPRCPVAIRPTHPFPSHELDDAHLGVVAAAEAVLEHARVAAVAVGVALGRVLKERVHELLVIHVAERLPPRVQRAVLGERDHVVDALAQLLGARERRGDLAVADHLGRQAAQQRLALVSRPVQLPEALAVALRIERRRRVSRCRRAMR